MTTTWGVIIRFITISMLFSILIGCDSDTRQSIRRDLGLRYLSTGKHPNGSKKFERTYEGSLLDGIAREYYEDGQLKSQEEFKDNVYNGMVLQFSEVGYLVKQCEYKSGLLDGHCTNFFGKFGGKGVESYRMGLNMQSEIYSALGVLRSRTTNTYSAEGSKTGELVEHADRSSTFTKFEKAERKYKDFFNPQNEFIKRLGFEPGSFSFDNDWNAKVSFVMKENGEYRDIFDSTETKLLGRWDKENNYYNESGIKIGYAGAKGQLIYGPRPTPTQDPNG